MTSRCSHVARVVLGVSWLSAGGCAGDIPTTGTLSQDVTGSNGLSLNGLSLNGLSLNGLSLNGLSLNGLSLNGTSTTGLAITAATGSAEPWSGSGLVGTTWQAQVSDGSTLPLTVDSATAGANSLWFYDVSYATQSGRQPICGKDDAGADILAVTVPGVWNLNFGTTGGGAYTASTTQFTFGCRGKTVAKCVELGYVPWAGYSEEMQACVRMLRGDYCGNGTGYTVTGQTINLYDEDGIQADTEAWNVDAAWSPTGATCIGKEEATRYYQTGVGTPTCVTDKTFKNDPKCGAKFANGAILIDETP